MDVSIITPSFDQLDLLRLASQSVADQMCPSVFEHLIQEGKGGDNFERWSVSQSFAKCYVESDKGMYDAINRGFDRAEGEILGWLNCDEQYLPGTLAKVVDWFAKHPEDDVLIGDVVLINDKAEPISYRGAVRPWTGHIRSCFLPTHSAATFIRREVFTDGHRLDTRYRMIADAVWIKRLIEAGYQIGVMNEPLSVFVQNGENMGQTVEGRRESDLWRGHGTLLGQIRKKFWTVLHHLRRFSLGHYRARDVEVSIYQSGSSERVRVGGSTNGYWQSGK